MSVIWTFVLFAGFCYDISEAANDCVTRGRFPNDEFPDCRGHTTCIAGAGDVFYKYDLACPENFIYNHIDSQCSNATYYTCLPTYNCTGVGTFQNPNRTDCKTYVACIKGLTNIVTARLVECPPNTTFSVVESACVNETTYQCPLGIADVDPSGTLEIVEENGPTVNAATQFYVSFFCKIVTALLFVL